MQSLRGRLRAVCLHPGIVVIEIGSGWCKGSGALLEDYWVTHRTNEEAGEARSENGQGPKAAGVPMAWPPRGARASSLLRGHPIRVNAAEPGDAHRSDTPV